MSFLKEEECTTSKNSKQAESPTCTKIEHTFLQVRSSTIYNSQTTRYEHSKLTWQAIATQKWLSALSDVTNFVLWCYPCLTVAEGCVTFQSNSLENPQAYTLTTQLFCNYFYWHINPHTSYNSTRCAIYSTHERFCFHHSQNTLFLLPLQKNISCALVIIISLASFLSIFELKLRHAIQFLCRGTEFLIKLYTFIFTHPCELYQAFVFCTVLMSWHSY